MAVQDHDVDVGPDALLTPSVAAEGDDRGTRADIATEIDKRGIESGCQGIADVLSTVADPFGDDRCAKVEEGLKC